MAIAGFAFVLASLWASWQRFPVVWNEFREHGFAVAGIALWLLWRDRVQLAALAYPEPLVAIPLALASLLWMFGVAVAAQVIHLLLVPFILVGWLWAVRGRAVAQRVLPVALLFLLGIPLWEVLVPLLQQMTVLVNHLAIRVTGIHAEVTGTYIKLPYGTLYVAQSCAGLNYLMSALSLGGAYALGFLYDRRSQVKVVATAAGLALVSNWIRVFGLVVVADATKMQSSLMQSHGLYGWIIFACMMPIFGYLAGRIECAQPQQSLRPVETPVAPVLASGSTPFATVAATAAALAGPVLLLLINLRYSPAPSPESPPGVTPMGTWSPDAAAPVWTPILTGSSSRITRAYTFDGRQVQIDRFIYGNRSERSDMLSVTNRVVPDSLVASDRAIGPLDENLRTVRESVVATGSGFRLIWWWYHVAGVDTPVSRRAQLLEFWALLSDAAPSEIVLVSTACDNRDCAPARAAVHEVTVGRPLQAPTTR